MSEHYIYKKEVDWSLLHDGISIPCSNQVVFGQIMGRFLKRGESKDITLYFCGNSYNRILPAEVSIDHFVPWSYVAHDELWNLNPTIREINSAKSNNLPEWDRYFGKLVDQEYKALKVTWENDAAFTAFLDCQKAHVNSDEVKLFLYTEKVDKTEFGNRLEKILLPVYESAKNSGFREWVYKP